MSLTTAQWTLLLEQQVNHESALNCSVVEPEPEVTEEMYSQVFLNEEERENGWIYVIWMDTSGLHTRIKNPGGEWFENLDQEKRCFPSDIMFNLDTTISDIDVMVDNQNLFDECMIPFVNNE